MPRDVRPNEGTQWDHPQSLGPHIVQRPPHEFAPNAASPELLRHFRVYERDLIAVSPLPREREMRVEPQLVPLLLLVVDYPLRVSHLRIPARIIALARFHLNRV